MISSKNTLILFGTLAGALGAALPSQAQTQSTFASITGGGTTASNVFTYTPGSNGGFSITQGALFSAQFLPTFTTNAPATVSFTGLNNVGTLVSGGGGASSQMLSGGTFDVESGGVSLLNGTFADGYLLNGMPGASTAAITNTLDNVIFTGGTYFSQSGLYNPGSFSISMTSVSPALGISNNQFNSFVAGGTGTFSASTTPPAVPEPATVVPFVLGGLGLLGLIVRKTRRGVDASV